MNYLRKINRTWYFRLSVPTVLISKMGRREILKSLKTQHKQKAIPLCAKLLKHYIEEFERVTKGDKQTIDNRKITVDMISGEIGVEGMEPIRPTKAPPADPLSIKMPPSTEDISEKIDALSKQIDNISSIDKSSNITPILLKDAIDEYISSRIKDGFWTNKRTQDAHKNETSHFLRIVGNREVHKITPAQFKKYQTILKEWPAKYNVDKHGDFDTYLSTLEDGYKRIKYDTIDQRNGHINGFLKWCKNNFYITNILLPKIEAPQSSKDNDKDKKDIFNDEELKQIFSHGIWQSLKFQNDGQFFIPLIMIYTGMRSIECCKLRKEGVIKDNKYGWYIRVTDEGDKQRLKTKNSGRQVPIHDELISYGFLNLVNKTETEYLFPIYSNNERAFQKGVNERLLVKVGVKTLEKTCHSFRHTFGHIAERCKVSGSTIDKIRGHTEEGRSKMASTYGTREQLDIISEDYHSKFTLKDMIGSLIKNWGNNRSIKNNLRKK